LNGKLNAGAARRGFFISLGVRCVGIAGVGIVVPGLPATIFLIAASYLFARSSPWLDRKLRENRWFGPYLRRFAENRSMPRSAKIWALVLMWGGVALGCRALARYGLLPPAGLVALGLIGSGVILFYVRTDVSGTGHADSTPNRPR
jgi:uncharacterized membrane protein YbaN (DUF454 family)